jgi:FkbM family methyltransferase
MKMNQIIPRKLLFCDVGARGGIADPWKSFQDFLGLISFEPDKEEYEVLLSSKNESDQISHYALYKDKRELSLHLTKSRACSSVYLPNVRFLKEFPDANRFEIEKTVSVPATSLDALYREEVLRNMDFIKIDVQGAELDILQGGKKFLSDHILGVEVEVEFQAMYENQPLFSDVDYFIRNNLGLQLQDLRKTYWKYKDGIKTGASKGQLIFGDALYYRTPSAMLSWCSRFPKEESSSKIQMACLMGLAYGYLDYCLCLLGQKSIGDFLDKETISNWRNYITRYGRSFKYNGKGSERLAAVLNIIYRICQPTHEGWGSSGHHLGSKKKLGVFY